MGDKNFDAVRLANLRSHFAAYVDDGRLPGWQLQVTRRSEIALNECYGLRDLENGLLVEADTVFRIYSMTKPITAVAAMILYEEGRFELTDPVSKFVPAYADLRVLEGGTAVKPVTRPATEMMRIIHLLNHTSGMTYGFHHAHVQDEMYRNAGFELGAPAGCTLQRAVEIWAQLPLRFDPGAAWNYSVASDVLGRVIEIVSGQSLADFLHDRIFEPLAMPDTSFTLRGDMSERLSVLYVADGQGHAVRCPEQLDEASSDVSFLSGGAGLLSTAADYHRFTQMLMQGGSLDGRRILGTRTVRMMTRNSLPGGQNLEQCGIPLFAESTFAGHGFGFGLAVLLDPMAAGSMSTRGEYSWGGAANTTFWVDPDEQITVIFMTQLLPSSTHSIRPQLRQLVYSALID